MAENISTQLIDGDGLFNVRGMEAFMEAIHLAECGLSYAVVSIMGPQSSGKSTLLNHLFRTNFKEMNATKGKSQTTKGIWLARGVGINPCTIVMDLEGSDGRERGEDGTAFEKQSALFAFAVSNILLINMWDKDITRVQAASKPLLKTVFQTMTRLYELRKTTLLFVIRDLSKTPLTILEGIIRKDIQEIWNSVDKKEDYKEFGKFFHVDVVALPSYEYREEQFKEEVARLRQRFYHSIAPGGLAGDRQVVLPAAEFSASLQAIWKDIKENKDLYLPTYTVMVAVFRCDAIVREKVDGFSSDKKWKQLKEAEHGFMPQFGQTLSVLLDKFLSEYNKEAQHFDDGVRTEKRMYLELKLLQLAYPVYESMLSHLRSKTLHDLKEAFDKALGTKELIFSEGFAAAKRDCTKSLMSEFDAHCKEAKWESLKVKYLKVREKIIKDINAYMHSVRKRELVKMGVSIPVAAGLGATALAMSIAVPAVAPVAVAAAVAGIPASAAALCALVNLCWIHK